MNRVVAGALDRWLEDPDRRPLVLRGARQVGKTWLVRDLAARSGRDLVEVNLERDPSFARCFRSNAPATILGELSLALDRDIAPERSLLFLDEVQSAGAVLGRLRWFQEEMPSLPVVAAGSLLELTLRNHDFSMPVGRVSFRHVEPMGFLEFLDAHGQARLIATLREWRPGTELSEVAHERGMAWFQRYAMVGGMPAVVAADVGGRGPRACREMQRDLVAAFRADFSKYSGRMDPNVLDATLSAVAGALGRKLVHARLGEGVKQHQARRALDLLAGARVCHLVRHSAANGLPLGAETKDTFRKAILADVGLAHALLGTPAASAFPSWSDLAPSVRGQLADQLAGQQLRLLDDGTGDGPQLHYWQREGGRPGEIDYLVVVEGRIVPVELKSGAAGSMKSLHQFMFDKRLRLAVRCDANPPGVMDVSVKTTRGDPVAYRLVSLPPYLLWALAHAVASALRRERG
jgi:predicted AAA+ superfamily ATPase